MRRKASASGDSGAEQEQEAYAITRAQAAHSEGVDSRMRRYLLQMAIRVLCILVAVLVDGWIRWAAVVGAMVLPWVAVVLANGSDRAEVRNVSFYTDPEPAALPAPADGPRGTTGGTENHHASWAEAGEEPDGSTDGKDEVIEGEFTEGPAAHDRRGRRPWT